jgi:ABC-type sugar transport system permease subunit
MSTPPADLPFDNADHPILSLPLVNVMRPQIALTLQHMLQIYTVGSFLNAWRNPRYQKSIEQVFDTPQQARHAVAVCATWLGVPSDITHSLAGAWWSGDERPLSDA